MTGYLIALAFYVVGLVPALFGFAIIFDGRKGYLPALCMLTWPVSVPIFVLGGLIAAGGLIDDRDR